MPNDQDLPVSSRVTLEIWRNRVYPAGGLYSAVDWVARVAAGAPHHLFLVVRYDGEDGEIGRFEIYEPEDHPPRDPSRWDQPFSFGGFLQRRASGVGKPARDRIDPEWGLSLVWARTEDDDAWRAFFSEEHLARYRWRDHYPVWRGNFLGRYINSNAFVEKIIRELGLTNRDGSPIDLTDGGRLNLPGLGRAEGFDFAFDGDTSSLHAEWNRLHGDAPFGARRWYGAKVGVAARYVPRRSSGPLRPPSTSRGASSPDA